MLTYNVHDRGLEVYTYLGWQLTQTERVSTLLGDIILKCEVQMVFSDLYLVEIVSRVFGRQECRPLLHFCVIMFFRGVFTTYLWRGVVKGEAHPNSDPRGCTLYISLHD